MDHRFCDGAEVVNAMIDAKKPKLFLGIWIEVNCYFSFFYSKHERLSCQIDVYTFQFKHLYVYLSTYRIVDISTYRQVDNAMRSKEKLAELIRQLRGDQSQRAFAKTLQVSFASIQSWENGDAMPSTENLSAIAHKSGYTLQGLIAYLEDRPIPKNTSIEEIVMHIRSLPLKQLALVEMAVGDRLMAIAESAGR